MSDHVRVSQVIQTTIELKVIREQLDIVESALLTAWRHLGRTSHAQEQEQQISDAIDNLLAVKKTFGFPSDLIPVKERQTASSHVLMPEGPGEE